MHLKHKFQVLMFVHELQVDEMLVVKAPPRMIAWIDNVAALKDLITSIINLKPATSPMDTNPDPATSLIGQLEINLLPAGNKQTRTAEIRPKVGGLVRNLNLEIKVLRFGFGFGSGLEVL